ncbi:MAG: DUF2975 domain-containing protein [Bacteroidetes bacterium]|nr:DUF2975 domain-containing protein [Bacteroidota bacterium]
MEITTRQILKGLYILSWIIFIGVCIDAGGFLFNAFYTLAINPADARHFWPQIDFSGLYGYDKGYFFVITFMISIVEVSKAIMFYLILKILHDKKLDMSQPFTHEVRRFIFKIAYLTLLIGIFSNMGSNYVAWLTQKGVKMPNLEHLRLGGADVWLFMAITLYVIAQIFKRGIEIQTENELTV